MKKEKLLTVTGSFTLIVVIAALMLAAGPGPASAQEKPIELKMSVEQGPEDGKYIYGHKPWVDMVEEATQDRVKVVIYPLSSLATGPEAYDVIIQGTADIAWVPLPLYPKRFPLTEAYRIPGSGIKDPIIASRIIWSLYNTFPEMQKEFDEVKVLFMHAMAPLAIATMKQPIRSLSDMTGLKIASAGGPTTVLFESVGASPMPQPPLKTLASRLEQGVIDGSTSEWEFFKTFGITKIANYYTVITTFIGPNFAMIMNKDTWNDLPPDIQQAIMSVSGDVGSTLFAEGDLKTSQIVMDELRAQGKEIIYLSPEENARWADLARPIQEKQIADLEAKGLPARAVFNEIVRMVKEYQPNELIASKPEDIVGIWETWFVGSVAYMQFEADGTLTLAYNVRDSKNYPILSGTFWFEGSLFKMKDNVGSGIGTYEIHVQKKDGNAVHLAFHAIEDPDATRRYDLSRGMTRSEQ
jgi:TRAP-type C4-dicarboxylate transport system substrate-binding protein